MTQESAPPATRVAVVTGGSRGLGRAFAVGLVRRGWHVVTDARDPVRLAKTVAEIGIPHAVTAISGDVSADLHQQAFPGEDISDRPPPDSVVPALLALAEADLPSGRYRAAELMMGIVR